MVLDRNLEFLALWYSFLKLTLSFHFQMKISTSQGWPFKIHAFYEPCLQLEYPATSPLSPSLPEKLESHLKYNLLPRPPFSAPGLSLAVLPLPQPCLHCVTLACLFRSLYNEFLMASALFSIIPRLLSSSNSIWPMVPSQ